MCAKTNRSRAKGFPAQLRIGRVKPKQTCKYCQQIRRVRHSHGLCDRCAANPVIRRRFKTAKIDRNPPVASCRHCKKGNPTRPRGLCYGCYSDLPTRNSYPPTSHYARHGIIGSGVHQLPIHPTSAQPGTAEKICVLMDRAQRGESLWHPLDNGSRFNLSDIATVMTQMRK